MALFKKKSKERLLFSEKKRKTRNNRKDRLKIKNVELENTIFRRRFIIAIVVSISCMLILFVNLYYLQVISYDDYQTRSNDNRIRVLPIPPKRGIIYDRNHVVIADNLPVYHLEIYPTKDIDTKKTIIELNELLELNLSEKDIKNLVYLSKTRKRFTGIEIADLLTESQLAKFSVNRYKYPNIKVNATLKRNYPFDDITTHALGYVSRINQTDMDKLEKEGKVKNYEGTNSIGKLGLEKYYEDILHGEVGSEQVEVNSHGQIIRILSQKPSVPGHDIVVSLDIRLQYYAQQLLANMKGAIVAVEPSTGEILAFYSNPSYNPNLFVRGIRSSKYNYLLNHPGKPLINRVTQGSYSPASTIKPLLVVMGLNENLITPTSGFFGQPAFMLPGSTHKFRDWKPYGHGWLDAYRAVEVSADTYFYDLAHRAGIDTIHRYLDLFGFGRSTNIDISEESVGINPSREWREKKSKQPWHLGDTIPIGIGQGFWTTTLMQLVKAHTTLVNYGEVKTPHFLVQVLNLKDNSAIDNKQFYKKDKVQNIDVQDKSYWDVAKAGMYLVINGPEGTGRRAFMGTAYKAAGKSGTAQVVSIKQGEKYDAASLKQEHRDNALFVAFAPYKKPRILVGVILENEGGGSSMAAPLVRKLMDKYFELYPNGYMGESQGEKIKFGMGGTVLVQ